MADSSSGSASASALATRTPASVIASEFIRAYYNALSNEPQSLYAFYEDDSKFSRFEEGQISDHAQPAQGQLAIHEAVCAIPYAGCKVRIETTDSHESSHGCVIVIVTGIIVLSNEHPRTFVQTFVLQPVVTASGEAHYYVRNDILRYTSKITPAPTTLNTSINNHLTNNQTTTQPTPTPTTTATATATSTSTSTSRPSSPKKQTLAAPPSPQVAPLRAPPSPVKPVAEPVITPEPLPVRPVSPAVPKSPQRSPEPAPAPAPAPVVASPPPEEIPVAASPAAAAAASATAAPIPVPVPAESKPQRVRKVKREKPAPAQAQAQAPATEASGPAASTSAPAAAAPVEVKQEQKAAPVKVVEKKVVAKAAPVQPPRPTTWASRLFNAAKDGPAGAGAAKPTEENTEATQDTTTATPHVNGDVANAATTATAPAQQAVATAEQPVRKPRSQKRASSGKPEGYKQVELHSLWVNNIPSTVTQPDLTALFSQYGSLRPIRLVAGKTYCFVDYYTAEGADAALAARPLRIQGAELSVDKKLLKQSTNTATGAGAGAGAPTGTAATTTGPSRPASASASAAGAKPSTSNSNSNTSTGTAPAQLEDGFQKPTAGRSRAYKQRVASENKAAAATQVKKVPAPTNGAAAAAGAGAGAPRK